MSLTYQLGLLVITNGAKHDLKNNNFMGERRLSHLPPPPIEDAPD